MQSRRWIPLIPLLLLSASFPARGDGTGQPTGARAAEAGTVSSHLGNPGPAYQPGMTPKALGWGPDTQAYPGKFVVNPKDGAEMAWVPPGEFLMGAPATESGSGDDERPVHRVRLTRGCWMYRHDVTNAQYRKLEPRHDSGEYDGMALNGDRQPVARVTWEEARAYAEWAGAALPTEAQWEYACRAGTTGRFWWGESETEAGKYANIADHAALHPWPWWIIFDTDDGYAASSPVGSYLPNAFGLYDMIGNAWQWCADWFAEDTYQHSPAEDPTGPPTGQYRVIRGGSWDVFPAHSRAAYRHWLIPPDSRYPWLGFRCVVAAG